MIPTIKQVLLGADEPSDRVSAAIALWELGDASGIPVAIELVEMIDGRYGGGWEDPVWLLCRSHTEDGLESLRKVITKGPPERAGEVITHVVAAVTGDLRGKSRKPAGSLAICPVLVDAMSRGDLTDRTVNGVQQRIKDLAAKAFAVLRERRGENTVGIFVEITSDVFNELEPDLAKRDAQISALAKWYSEHKDRLAWDPDANRLKTRQP